VHPPLATLHTPANEVLGHSRSIQAIPREQRHQLLHLPGQLWSLIPGHSLVRNIPDVAQRSAVGHFTNVKPLLVPLLPQAKQISKEVEMGLDSPIRLTQVDKDRNKEDRVRMQIANPNLIIQT
jgi:hypothetical protein